MRALGACSCSFNGFSSTTPLTTTITPRATTVGLKDTLDGRPGPTQIRPSFSFAMLSFTRTIGLLLMTNHALEDKAMACCLFQRSLQIASTKYALYALRRPMWTSNATTLLLMSASALYQPNQALLDGNRHRNQICYDDALWRTRKLTACHSASQRSLPRLFLGKLISLWTMIWTCAAPPHHFGYGGVLLAHRQSTQSSTPPSELLIVNSMALYFDLVHMSLRHCPGLVIALSPQPLSR